MRNQPEHLASPPDRVIQTDRLTLRPHLLSDYHDVRALWADPTVTHHIFPEPLPEAEAWFRLLRYTGHWDLLGYGYWAVIDRKDGSFLGELGFGDFRRDAKPRFDGDPEAGWIITSAAQGQGYAKEAMNAALSWMDQNRDISRTVAMISPANAGSLRLAEKLGYSRSGTTLFKGRDRIFVERAQGGTKPLN